MPHNHRSRNSYRYEDVVDSFQWDFPSLSEPELEPRARVIWAELERQRRQWSRSQKRYYSRCRRSLGA